MPFRLLSRLWLTEPDNNDLVRARLMFGQALPFDLPALAQAYADLFLLNVYPYGTVFTHASAELNGPGAQRAARLYAAHNYEPPELAAVGAPDHLGLGLGLLGLLAERRQERAFGEACAQLLAWAPAACLAVAREPGAHEFYRALAAYTGETLLLNAGHLANHADSAAGRASLELPASGDDEEVRLRDVVRFLLAPARCGVFFSRGWLGRLGRDLDLSLPFSAREAVAEMLFKAAGQAGQTAALLAALAAEVRAWADAYRAWAAAHPAWAAVASAWLARTSAAQALLTRMADDHAGWEAGAA